MDSDNEFIGTIHDAGPDAGGLQLCRRCGGTITDYRRAMTPKGSPPLRGYAEGPVTFWGELSGTNSSAAGIHQPAIPCRAEAN